MTAIQEDLIKKFIDKMFKVDKHIKREDVISESIKMFVETKD